MYAIEQLKAHGFNEAAKVLDKRYFAAAERGWRLFNATGEMLDIDGVPFRPVTQLKNRPEIPK